MAEAAKRMSEEHHSRLLSEERLAIVMLLAVAPAVEASWLGFLAWGFERLLFS